MHKIFPIVVHKHIFHTPPERQEKQKYVFIQIQQENPSLRGKNCVYPNENHEMNHVKL